MKIFNPATGELLKDVKADDAASVKNRFLKAELAQKDWARVGLDHRISCVKKFRDLLAASVDVAAQITSQEVGKPKAQAAGEVKATLGRIDWFLTNIKKILADEVVHQDGPMTEKISYEPLGVIGNISAWNFPYFVGTNVYIPALLAGNAVLYKPSEFATMTGQLIESMMVDAGVPRDVFQTVVGTGDVGRELLKQPIKAIYFTGSYRTGKQIAEAAASSLMRVQLELGGKDPAYVCEDVNVKAAAEGVGDGAFYNAGQSCCAVERIYVHAKIHDEFLTHLVNFAKAAKVGDPMLPDTYIGSLARKDQLDVLDKQVADAVKKGAKVLCGGKRLEGKGAFYQVTVVSDANHKMDIMMEESFGPIIAVQKVSSDEEAIKLMNDTPYGLTASIHTSNRARAEGILKQMNTGTVYWNCCDRVSAHLPWTGRGHSGVGSTLSKLGVMAFVQPKAWHLKELS
jgi:acyl-CoA reductase-like NAD-dependent aldehyde dehydrogenase